MRRLLFILAFLPFVGFGQFETELRNSDTTLVFNNDIEYGDTYWDDLTFGATQGKQGNTSKPDFDYTEVALLFPVNDSSEKTYYNVQMPHRWKYGTDIEPHVHWMQSSSDTVQFRIKYRVSNIGEAEGSWLYLESENMTQTYVSGTLHQYIDIPGIDMSGKTGSCILDIILYRIDAGGAGSLSGDCKVKDFDIHYQIDKPGSDNEIPD